MPTGTKDGAKYRSGHKQKFYVVSLIIYGALNLLQTKQRRVQSVFWCQVYFGFVLEDR